MRTFIILGLIPCCFPTVASAKNEYLTELTSEVYQSPGTPRALATKAQTCISQLLRPGTTDAQLIINSDLDGGLIVARNAISYPDGLMQWQVRSTFTFEAREGRFRILQTNLERFNNSWAGIGKWTGSGWKKAEQAYGVSATKVADCVRAGPSKESW